MVRNTHHHNIRGLPRKLMSFGAKKFFAGMDMLFTLSDRSTVSCEPSRGFM